MFEVKSMYEESDFIALQKARNRKNKYRWISGIAGKISCFITGVILIPALLYGIYRVMIWEEKSFLTTVAGLLFCFMLLSTYTLIFTGIVKVSKILWRNYADRVDPFTLDFAEEFLTSTDPLSQSRYEYAVIKDIWEDNSRFYLHMYHGLIIILRKNAFTQGDPEQFREFIAQKTGKAVEYVK